ncbi:MAG: GAF domain-containing protein [Minisyncoccia bacterium]|jgi:GAF domain-containing protein
MQQAPIPPDEDKRLEALARLGILDTPREERFDRITKEVTEKLRVPISTISIIDKNREWYKSCQGLSGTEADRSISFCAHALLAKNVFVVEDTSKDQRFADNPMVVGPPYIRFYAGVVLSDNQTGQPIGVLCAKDTKPHAMSMKELDVLLGLARQAESEINKRPLNTKKR